VASRFLRSGCTNLS